MQQGCFLQFSAVSVVDQVESSNAKRRKLTIFVHLVSAHFKENQWNQVVVRDCFISEIVLEINVYFLHRTFVSRSICL